MAQQDTTSNTLTQDKPMTAIPVDGSTPKVTLEVVATTDNPAPESTNTSDNAVSVECAESEKSDTSKEETPKKESLGFFARLKQKWTNHVTNNKKKAEDRKNVTPVDSVENKDTNEKTAINDSPINDENGGESSNTDESSKPKNQSDEDIDFENFDPKKDRKKLTSSLRKRIRDSELEYKKGTLVVKDVISPSSMEVTPKVIKLGDRFVRSFIVYNYPRFLSANWLSQVINFDATIDMSMFIYPTDSSKIMGVLRKKVAEMLSTKHMQENKGMVSDVSLNTALEDAEQLRVDLQRGKEKFFQMGLYFTVIGETEKKLQSTADKLQTLLGGQLIMTRPADFRTERAFNSTLPQGTDEVQVFRNMNTSPLSTAFPFVSSNLTSNSGILYGVNRHNNSLVLFDRFQLENANSVIFAKSGSGKSYTVKLEILRSLMMGTDVIIIDPENEYENLSRAVGGTYVKISINSPHRINPFDLPSPIEGEIYNTEEAIRENIINITGLLNIMLGKLSPQEDGIVDRALAQCYEIKGITPKTVDPHKYEMPTMKDLQSILESYEGGKELSVRIQKYTDGSFSGLFSGQTNVDLAQGLICFCIRDLEDALRPIAMYILLNFIWSRVRSELRKRLLIIDEAWNIVQYDDSGRFLHNLVKRARKYYLGITTITQDTEDFMGSPWGKPIITNSSLQILLRQAPSAIDILSKIFNLTEGEKYLLLSSEVGQGLFFAGNSHAAIQVIASPSEHKLVTTNPEEVKQNRENSE